MPPANPSSPTSLTTGKAVRAACRSNTLHTPTAGLATSFVQANLIVLPEKYASDFRLLCARNPVPCPLIAESAHPGSFSTLTSHLPHLSSQSLINSNDLSNPPSSTPSLDLRRDLPQYNIYTNAQLRPSSSGPVLDLLSTWTTSHVAFLIGCSFSFENGLAAAGLPPRHVQQGRNVPMYRTCIPLCAAGVFQRGTYVVSMRPYRAGAELDAVREVTRRYGATHGEPIAWGWDAVERLGIADLDVPEWGDAPLRDDGGRFGEIGARRRRGKGERGDREEGEEEEVPVFWGCGVTTQEAVVRAGLEGTVMAHAPGHMLVLDCRDEDVISAL